MGTYNSIIIDAPANEVWSTLRNFNDMSWAEGIVESLESVNGKGGTEIGAQRLVNGAITETLQSFDDDAMTFTYSIDEGPDVLASHMVQGYVGRARVAPITATGKSFVEWSSDWEDAKGDVKGFCDPLYAGLLGLVAKRVPATTNQQSKKTGKEKAMFKSTLKSIAAVSAICAAALSFALLAEPLSTPAAANDASDDISWVLSLNLADGQDAAFEELMAEMVTATMAEAGAKTYEWKRKGNAVHIVERYESNADAGIHLGNFSANFAEQFLAILTPASLQVYGPAEGGVREGLAGLGAVFYEQVGGFDR